MHRLKLILYFFFLTILFSTRTTAEGTFEDAELVNEFMTMTISASHPYDLRHTIPGEPDIDYPIYSTIPKTNFDCTGHHEGYYADKETRCQVFRICTNTDHIGKGFAFLCPNGTLFSQKNFVCDWYRNVDCSNSERYYSKNEGSRIGSKSEIMETVRFMMEHPMKTISAALNRGKPITPQPLIYKNSPVITTESVKSIQTTPSPLKQVVFNQQPNTRRQPVTLDQVESAARGPQPIQQNPSIVRQDLPNSARVNPNQTPSVASLPTVKGFFITKAPISAPLSGISSNNSTQSTLSQSSTDEEDVYVSSLGELSTDPGANFNLNTAHIIAEPTPSPIKTNNMHFATKVNAVLNGQQVVNKNEMLAPEYVQNILHQNVHVPNGDLQPPLFNFASNINSLLDEVAYDTELEGQTSMHVQLRTPSEGPSGSTRKPFQFLSRGFSSTNANNSGAYMYGSPTQSKKNTKLPVVQLSTPTQSLITTPLFTAISPITSTEATHILVSPGQISVSPNVIKENDLQRKKQNQSKTIDEYFKTGSEIDIRFGSMPSVESTITNDRTKGKIQQNINSGYEIPQEINDGNKANANKRAEKLLLAGFKQTVLGSLSQEAKQNHIPEIQGTLSTTISTTTFAPSTQTIRRYTVSNGQPRQTSRPITYTKRQNLVRSGLKPISSTATLITTVKPNSRFGQGTTSPKTTTASTVRPTLSTRQRQSGYRYMSTSQRRRSTTTTNTPTTTLAPSKKLSIRSSDKDTSDLTAVASTYNSAQKRDYNKIRQNSYRYMKAQIRRPSQRTSKTEADTKSASTPSSTTQHPKSSSSLPTPTLAPFSLSSTSTTHTVDTLPASYLSFKDLTNAITDDSILQTFKRNQDFNGSTLRPATIRDQAQVTPKTHIRQVQAVTVQSTTRAPQIHLKDFLNIKFGVPTLRPSTPQINDQKHPAYIPTYPMQQYDVPQNYFPQTTVKPVPTVRPAPQQIVPKQQSFVVQQQKALQQTQAPQPTQAQQQQQILQPKQITQQVPQYPQIPQQQQISQLRQIPQQQMFFQQQLPLHQRYAVQQQHIPQQQQYRQVAPLQQIIHYPSQPIIYRSLQTQPFQQLTYRFPAQQQLQEPQQIIQPVQYYQQVQTQPQQIVQVPQYQLNQRAVHIMQPSQQLQSNIEIFPSQMAAAQTIPSQRAPVTDDGSINVRLPTNLAGLIPNTINNPLPKTEMLSRAQKRIDTPNEPTRKVIEKKSVFAGVSSYEVPISSIGRLTNDITHLLRRIRRRSN